MVEGKIQSECDQEMMALQLHTVEEQLKLHIKHSGTDQDMILKMMNEIENLKEEKYDLSEQLQEEFENNERRLELLSDQRNDDFDEDDKHRFTKSIERYHCKLLALESVIEGLRRRGIEIPEFPKIERKERMIGVNKGMKSVVYQGTDDEKQKQRIDEFMKEITFWKSKNDDSSNKFRDVNDVMVTIKQHLSAQEKENNELRIENLEMRDRLEDEAVMRSNIGRAKVFKLAMLVAFIVGITHRKRGPLINKIYL